jgi:transcription initiation factor TFIID TATA-box-binding protein
MSLSNVVATVNLLCRLDLKMIALKVRNVEYNPKRFSACVIRIRKPKATGLVFASGKMVVTGASDEKEARNAGKKFSRIISKVHQDCKFKEFKVQKIVASCDVGFKIDLQGLAFDHEDYSNV